MWSLKKYIREFFFSDILDELRSEIKCLENGQSEILDILKIQDVRSANAYTVSDAIMSGINIVDDKIERFQGLWQLDNLSRYENLNELSLTKHIHLVRSYLKLKDVDDLDHDFVRVGKSDDGGYVMWNDFLDAQIAYSIGIADDVSWDKSMLIFCPNIDIYQYDHTISNLPEENSKFHWEKLGVCGRYNEMQSNLKTLTMLVDKNGHNHEDNMILKIDVEGAEYEVLANLPVDTLKKFSQIVIEYHDLTNVTRGGNIISALERLNITHQLVHIHANNFLPYVSVQGKVLPQLLECTYLSKEKYKFKESQRVFPTELDRANYYRHPEIYLGTWK